MTNAQISMMRLLTEAVKELSDRFEESCYPLSQELEDQMRMVEVEHEVAKEG